MKVGDRIEIPVHADLWMRGARFGTLKEFHKDKDNEKRDYWTVKIEHQQVRRLFRLYRDDWAFIRVMA